MKNISKLICLILAISAISVDSGQCSNPNVQFDGNSNSLLDNFGNNETCQRISKCQQYGPIICCPPTCLCPPQGGGTMGGQIGGNGQNKQNEQNEQNEQNKQNEENENIPEQSVSQRKCLQNYPPLPIVQKEQSISNISGGEPFPYMAAIGFENKDGEYEFWCGGFLVHSKFVVTGGRCAIDPERRPAILRLGSKSLNTTEAVNIKIAKIIAHPKYKLWDAYNDIAVFQLESEVTNRPVCLWQSEEINFQEGTAIGYGTTEFYLKPSTLMKVKLSIFSNEECKEHHYEFYEPGIGETLLCAGDRKGVQDTCLGDAGGPLLVTSVEQLQVIPYVIGITSFGKGCFGGVPTVFTRISSFIPWIESVVWPNEF